MREQLKQLNKWFSVSDDPVSWHVTCRRCSKWFRLDKEAAEKNDRVWEAITAHMLDCKMKRYPTETSKNGNYPEVEDRRHVRDTWDHAHSIAVPRGFQQPRKRKEQT